MDDPLRGTFGEDMEDLTAHLAHLPAGRSSHDGLDLGDNTELQGNMDRFRALASLGDDGADDLFTPGFGGLGLGGSSATTATTATANYPTYGELAAAGKPPSYEDSIMYDQAPLGLLAPAVGTTVGAVGGGGAVVSDPLLGPLGGGGGGGGSNGGAAGSSSSSVGAAAAPTSSAAASASPLVSGIPPQEQVMYSAAAPGSQAPGTPPQAGGRSGGAGAAAAAAAALLDPLAVPGSGEFRDDLQALSPQRTTPAHLASGAGRGGGGGGGAAVVISVTEPIRREAGGLFGIKGGYVSYLVKARPRGSGGGGTSGAAAASPAAAAAPGETAVRRRFREFVALADLLKARYRGYFVPPRPEKNAVEGQRMTDAFVEERRLALERYLNKLARHPVLSASEELRLFLSAEGDLDACAAWSALRPLGHGGGVLDGTARFSKQILGLDRAVTDPVQAAQPTKKSTDFMRAIKETARSMQNKGAHGGVGGPGGPASGLGAAAAAEEAGLLRAREELDTTAAGLTSASRAAERLVSRLDRWAVVAGELGLSLFGLAQAEQAEGAALAQHTGTLKQSGQLMHDSERAGTALVRASRIGRKVTGRCAIELGVLHEYLGLMPAAHKGLRAREKALLTADTLQADLEARRRAIGDLEAAGAKVLGGDAAKAKKVAELSGDVSVLEQSIAAARSQYDKIKDVNRQEMSRLQCELRGDLLAMAQHYGAVMEAAARRDTEIWLQAATELGATPAQLAAAKASLVQPPGAARAAAATAGAAAGAGAGAGAGVGPAAAAALGAGVTGTAGERVSNAPGLGGGGGGGGAAAAVSGSAAGGRGVDGAPGSLPAAGVGAGVSWGVAAGAGGGGFAAGSGSMGEVDLHGTGPAAAGAAGGSGNTHGVAHPL
ncbi:hypothetical protein CHLRE_10g462300v5 [Chlamydomonas reinhardtii]|uniref:PX domain-containing protein n=1 Tax=Chlamydomonas reinhardtii TaxID=3055 RepID=A0A2K3DBZ6_CHLRE|nr:uncharacterized protein CHLRE_10g462300v5 [Chlamydomonas reinhardtii]PNW78052.1 hypothetical protein CHLRE_10g462300v5 [Chlamydomonas reinhardtii]